MLTRIIILFVVVIITGSQARQFGLTCATNSMLYNRTECELCIIEVFNNNSTTDGSSVIQHGCVRKSNLFRRASQRCTGFSNATDTHYGVCSPSPYKTFNVYILCICATDFCNAKLITCQQSITQQLSSNTSHPSLLSSIYDNFTKTMNYSETIIADDEHHLLFDRCFSCVLWLIITLCLAF
jgi:hypothetical protein